MLAVVRVVVTGATGNVGTALLRWLVDQPAVDSVAGIARRPPGGDAGPAGERTTWHSIDISADDAPERLADVFAGADAVVHLAWRITADRKRQQQVRTNRHGSAAVVEAVRRARVGQLVHLSSAAVYSPAPAGAPVRENWPRRGIPGSVYSADKVAVEDLLDRTEADLPQLRVVRVRPPTVLQVAAAGEVTGLIFGRLAPLARLARGRVPVLPLPPGAITQAVAAQDVADLVGRAVLQRATGAYNVADDPVLTPADMARLLGGRHVPIPTLVARTLVDLTYRARVHRLDPSWLDVLLSTPLLECTKARTELGWRPRYDARDLLARMREAVAAGAGSREPPL